MNWGLEGKNNGEKQWWCLMESICQTIKRINLWYRPSLCDSRCFSHNYFPWLYPPCPCSILFFLSFFFFWSADPVRNNTVPHYVKNFSMCYSRVWEAPWFTMFLYYGSIQNFQEKLFNKIAFSRNSFSLWIWFSIYYFIYWNYKLLHIVIEK